MRLAWKLGKPEVPGGLENKADDLLSSAVHPRLRWGITDEEINNYYSVRIAQAVLHISEGVVLCD